VKANNDLDVLIIGAGFSGLYMLYKLRKEGYKTRIYEKGHGVGGTWYWNRYPGAGSDIESLEYSYGFDEQLQQDWDWKERYASQPELEAYLEHVAERFDLNKDIKFGKNVAGLTWLDDAGSWLCKFSDGEEITVPYVVMATGLLSAPKEPDFQGLDKFKGRTLVTSSWPHEPIDFSGRTVGIIGTGSTAVQAIPIIAEQAGQLKVFQRTPNFSAPRNNGPLDKEYVDLVKSDYKGWREKQRNSFGGYVSVNFQAMDANPNNAMDMTPEQRRAEYEFRWKSGGLSFYTSFQDLLVSEEANEELADFFREKIAVRIDDPAVAEKLLPRGYPVLTKRLCADTNYYETYNRQNVELIDISTDKVERFEADGIVVGGTKVVLDDIVIATGFDAVTGAAVRIDIRGVAGISLGESWRDGPRTQAGIMTHGYPNMFFVNGPGSCTGFFNPVLNVEYQGNWISDLLDHMKAAGFGVVDSTQEAEQQWVERMEEAAKPTLFWKSENWYIGANVPGKARVMLLYLGGFPAYKEYMEGMAESRYPGFVFGGD
jgi:cyclohexanone monooxygenase